MNEILTSLWNRKSVRAYREEPIPDELRKLILEAACQAPTAGNQQLYTILDVTGDVSADAAEAISALDEVIRVRIIK